jgi:para-nitrobenzyl esterase
MTRRLVLPSACLFAVFLLGCDSPSGAPSGDAGPSSDAGSAAPDAAPPTDPNLVQVEQGTLQGMTTGASRAFRGVPYAAPPLGELRWKRPQPPASWGGVRDATRSANTCLQISTSNQLLGGSEDCLYLNVWAPSPPPASPLPVLFWIHGGYNLNGAGSLPMYDGAYLAEHGPAVVVTINYRLGALGFANHPLLAAENTEGISGNYAYYDQIAALEWVHANIAAFGGDPGRVMIYGASAGGTATCVLYASPLAHGLFAAAIMESGSCPRATPSGAAAFDQVVANLSCQGNADVLACLRAQPGERVATAYPVDLTQPGGYRWSGAIVDGLLLPRSAAEILAAGTQNAVPFVVGTTADEYTTLLSHFSSSALASWADYEAEVARLLGAEVASRVLAEYPSGGAATPRAALVAVMTDRNMTCPARLIARAVATHDLPVWRYFFTHTYESGSLMALAAGHYLDVPFQFHNLTIFQLTQTGFVPTAAELALSDRMVGYWTRLAAAGDPNGGGAPTWPPYDRLRDTALSLDDTTAELDGIRTAHCNFWDSLH